jgi:P pilus assembly chaperone PapD
LPADLNRRLPSGKYKLTATLSVDGRRVKPLEKEIDFTGDPAVTKLAVDTALTLDPPEMTIAGAPGAMRTAVLKVENASDDEVNIEAASLVPPSLRGVALGELKGDDLSCAAWLEVSPAKFTLRAGGKQNVRVIAKMPKAENMQANYYGLVSLRAMYADGQGAGETKTLVCVANKGVEAKPAAQAAKMTLAAAEGAKYAVQARFANTGNTHFTPKCRAVVVTGQGQTVTEIELAGEEGLMLPLETRDFSGVLDFEKVEPGAYVLKVMLDSGPGQGAAQQMLIRVTVEEGLKVVTIVAPQAATSTAPASQPAGGGK